MAITVYDGNEIHVLGARRGAVLSFNPSNNRWRTLPRTELAADGIVAAWTGNLLLAGWNDHECLRSVEGSLDEPLPRLRSAIVTALRPCGLDAS